MDVHARTLGRRTLVVRAAGYPQLGRRLRRLCVYWTWRPDPLCFGSVVLARFPTAASPRSWLRFPWYRSWRHGHIRLVRECYIRDHQLLGSMALASGVARGAFPLNGTVCLATLLLPLLLSSIRYLAPLVPLGA